MPDAMATNENLSMAINAAVAVRNSIVTEYVQAGIPGWEGAQAKIEEALTSLEEARMEIQAAEQQGNGGEMMNPVPGAPTTPDAGMERPNG